MVQELFTPDRLVGSVFRLASPQLTVSSVDPGQGTVVLASPGDLAKYQTYASTIRSMIVAGVLVEVEDPLRPYHQFVWERVEKGLDSDDIRAGVEKAIQEARKAGRL